MAVVTLLRTLVRAGDADASAQANQNVNRARGYNFFFMLSSVEHGILNAHKYKNIFKISFLCSDKPRMLFFLLINVKMPTTIVGILTFMSRKNYMLG